MSRVKKEMVAEESVASERNENERPRRDVCKSYLKKKEFRDCGCHGRWLKERVSREGLLTERQKKEQEIFENARGWKKRVRRDK